MYKTHTVQCIFGGNNIFAKKIKNQKTFIDLQIRYLIDCDTRILFLKSKNLD